MIEMYEYNIFRGLKKLNFLEKIGQGIAKDILELRIPTNGILMKKDIRKIIDEYYDFGNYVLEMDHQDQRLVVNIFFHKLEDNRMANLKVVL